jgi:hypothetical protein
VYRGSERVFADSDGHLHANYDVNVNSYDYPDAERNHYVDRYSNFNKHRNPDANPNSYTHLHSELDSYTHSDAACTSSTSSCGGAWTTRQRTGFVWKDP